MTNLKILNKKPEEMSDLDIKQLQRYYITAFDEDIEENIGRDGMKNETLLLGEKVCVLRGIFAGVCIPGQKVSHFWLKDIDMVNNVSFAGLNMEQIGQALVELNSERYNKWTHICDHICLHVNTMKDKALRHQDSLNISLGSVITFVCHVVEYSSQDELKNGIDWWYPLSGDLSYLDTSGNINIIPQNMINSGNFIHMYKNGDIKIMDDYFICKMLAWYRTNVGGLYEKLEINKLMQPAHDEAEMIKHEYELLFMAFPQSVNMSLLKMEKLPILLDKVVKTYNTQRSNLDETFKSSKQADEILEMHVDLERNGILAKFEISRELDTSEPSLGVIKSAANQLKNMPGIKSLLKKEAGLAALELHEIEKNLEEREEINHEEKELTVDSVNTENKEFEGAKETKDRDWFALYNEITKILMNGDREAKERLWITVYGQI